MYYVIDACLGNLKRNFMDQIICIVLNVGYQRVSERKLSMVEIRIL